MYVSVSPFSDGCSRKVAYCYVCRGLNGIGKCCSTFWPAIPLALALPTLEVGLQRESGSVHPTTAPNIILVPITMKKYTTSWSVQLIGGLCNRLYAQICITSIINFRLVFFCLVQYTQYTYIQSIMSTLQTTLKNRARF